MTRIPCTIGLLTHNSGRNLATSLQRLGDFAEIIVCDGESSDDTAEIAQAYGAKVVRQDSRYLDSSGRVSDFGEARNHVIKMATQPWFFVLNPGEVLTDELTAELRVCCASEPAAYWSSRTYLWHNDEVHCSTTYPSKQMRFFAITAIDGYHKSVHEKLQVRAGFETRELKNKMLVSLETDRVRNWQKWHHYIALEVDRHGPMTLWQWMRIAFNHAKASLRYLSRLPRVLLCRKGRLPLWREVDEHLYNLSVVTSLWSKVVISHRLQD